MTTGTCNSSITKTTESMIHAQTIPPILNAEQVAELLHCSRRTVEDHARAGTLPGAKFGEGWVFVTELLMETVKQMSVKPAAEAKKTKARLVMVEKPGAKKPPGMAHLSEHAIREILSTK